MRILIVDDSSLIRSLMKTLLLECDNVSHVEIIRNGEIAISWLADNAVDIIIMDLEMPIMSGEECIRIIREKDNDTPIAVFSSQNEKDAKRVMKALSAGANDFFPKANEGSISKNIEKIQKQVLPSILSLGQNYLDKKTTFSKINKENLSLIKDSCKVLVIGASTGGPEAIRQIFTELDEKGNFPIFIVQHMPTTFTREFANSLNRLSQWIVKEAEDGEEVKPGHVYVAAGGKHLRVKNIDGRTVVNLGDDSPVQFLKPSIDVFMKTATEVFQNKLTFFVLSGMGNDGLISSTLTKEVGGEVFIQSRETCTIWGMPRSINEKDGDIQQVSPNEIAVMVNKFVKKRANS